jgi:transcriptional regulator with XRE-family HTH domain
MILQERLRSLRTEKNETQAQVAEAIGITWRQYQRFEVGTNLPGYQNFCALADHFGVSLDYLAGRTDER